MNHYLTPSKIGLLVLIEIYTESFVLNSSTIPIISFVLNQLLPHAPKTHRSESISSLEPLSRKLPFILDLKSFELLLVPHFATFSLLDTNLWDYFLKKLWNINSLDTLHVFFMGRKNLLVKSREEIKKDNEMGIPPPSEDMILLSHTSPFGSFIRKSCIEFERLKFSDTVDLWTTFVNWRRDSKPHWATENANVRDWTGDKALNDIERSSGILSTEILRNVVYRSTDSEDPEKTYVSTDNIEKLLEFQVEKMQRLGNRIPCEVMSRFKSILDQSLLIPSLSHYLVFLESWRSGDYPTSFDSLHRYFDYTMQNRDRLFYQYALMNLAVLQADFYCFDEAAAAMLETVSTARENKDMACLNFALNWLYHFGKVHPEIISETGPTNMLGVEREGLSYLRIKAKEAEMWTLWSSSLLSEDKLAMANGESLATVFENITKSSQLVIEKNLKGMIGPQTAILSSLWARLGISQLFKQHCEVFLSYHANFAVFEDTLRFTNRIAYLHAGQGDYEEALNIIESLNLNSLRSWKANQYWMKCKGIIRLKCALHCNQLDDAAQLLDQLLYSNDEDKDADLFFEINVLYIDYLTRRTDYSQALVLIEKLLSSIRKDGEDKNQKNRLLILKALLYDKAGRPQKGFSIALRAASNAWQARLMPTLWAAMGAISNILTSLAEFQASTQILIAIFPRVLECGDCELNAQLYSLLGDAFMGLAGQAEIGSLKRKDSLIQCFHFTERGLREFVTLNDIVGQRETTAKMATIMMMRNENFMADKYAKAYLELKECASS
ncbi:Anaphase-promoting complex subunit 5 [Golovinomyces cichoracearum]|uniref:Anaphase-promoting complex subunit 5 n=1 Tax=Golovinomyces cichoracearum TaxID=62708 RepID=A0A420IH73_9PEZI|nr:Anaphase-promoting complex subunit 5 [Golovinomyces cichoracearum]